MDNAESSQELLECFDEAGNIIEPHTRAEVHAEPLQFWHAVVGVWIFNSNREMLCSKRSDVLFGNPGKWQTNVGGHMKVGLSFKNTAVEEAKEEIGLKINPDSLFFVEERKSPRSKHLFEGYAYIFNGSVKDLRFNDGEIVEAKWCSVSEYMVDQEKNSDKWCNLLSKENWEIIKKWLEAKSDTFILGVRVDSSTKADALKKVSIFLNSQGQHKIFTPNPEMVVKAQKDEYFRTVLNSGDLNLCDGMGLQIFTGIKRITGVDFMLEVCKLASEQGKGVYLLGSGNDEVVHRACEELNKKFPNLKISGYNKGPEIAEGLAKQMDDGILEQINQSSAEVLFVAFGMGKQEKWIYENLAKMPRVKVAMGVGGAFDFISGKIRRAPLFLRKLGLEWVYRLVQEPKRIGRIFNATAVFCYLVLKKKIL